MKGDQQHVKRVIAMKKLNVTLKFSNLSKCKCVVMLCYSRYPFLLNKYFQASILLSIELMCLKGMDNYSNTPSVIRTQGNTLHILSLYIVVVTDREYTTSQVQHTGSAS